VSGYVHIFVLERATDGAPAKSTYQVNYTEPGVTFVRAFDRHHLGHFLTTTLAMDRAGAEQVMSQLQSTGRSNIVDVGLSIQEAAALSFGQAPSET
jgi:hypothetical protein